MQAQGRRGGAVTSFRIPTIRLPRPFNRQAVGVTARRRGHRLPHLRNRLLLEAQGAVASIDARLAETTSLVEQRYTRRRTIGRVGIAHRVDRGSGSCDGSVRYLTNQETPASLWGRVAVPFRPAQLQWRHGTNARNFVEDPKAKALGTMWFRRLFSALQEWQARISMQRVWPLSVSNHGYKLGSKTCL